MDTRWRSFSRSIITKAVVFMITILCFSSFLTVMIDIGRNIDGDFNAAFEKSYFQSSEFIHSSNNILDNLYSIIQEYKNKEHILAGGTLSQYELENMEDELYSRFQRNSKSYNPNLSNAENYEIFKNVYAAEIAQAKEELIQRELREYRQILNRLAQYQGVIYYAANGKEQITNSTDTSKEYFASFPAYLIFHNFEEQVFPAEIKENPRYHWLTGRMEQLGPDGALYVAFTPDFLAGQMEEWQYDQRLITGNLQHLGLLAAGTLAAFIFLIIVIGRKPGEEKLSFNAIDRIYNDLNIMLCMGLIGLWFVAMNQVFYMDTTALVFPITISIAACGLVLVLSLVKHLKNGTFIKHTLIYTVLAKLFGFGRDIFNSGSVGIKLVLVVIAYPLLVGATFFIFPITIGVAVWLAMKKVKEFQAIQEGVQKVKNGDLQHTIIVSGKGEFAKLAADINRITEGLSKAVANELKSERLKTELITNVSHDIRTPLTSIITYVDLLKKEQDPAKSAEYIAVIEQKSQRLKVLTEDLFEAAKASSGNMPVNFEVLDLVSLINQGLGELDDKIQERKLEFRFNYPQDKVLVKADGRLLWRAIENLLSNIFKYALEGSRVYIDIQETGLGVVLTLKNISAYELNIPAEELMERFKRGDESRSSQGSGLGLSIAKSLIELQKGRFNIEIDGDLFKAVIQLAKAE